MDCARCTQRVVTPAVSGPHRIEEALGGTHPERKGRKAGGGLGP